MHSRPQQTSAYILTVGPDGTLTLPPDLTPGTKLALVVLEPGSTAQAEPRAARFAASRAALARVIAHDLAVFVDDAALEAIVARAV